TQHISRVCLGGSCEGGSCASGFTDCDGNKRGNGCETNTATDPSHCGGCTSACSAANMATITCTSGQCSGLCLTGFSDCNNNKRSDGCETHTDADTLHCGGCSITCSSQNMATVSCTSGTCGGTCQAGYADCNSSKQSAGCEINLNVDPANCGACSNACPVG